MKIISESTESFFKRGKKIARLADEGKSIPESFLISFEDPKEFSSLLSPAKLQLIKHVRKNPVSVTDLAKILNRDRSAVSKDVSILENFGLVAISEKPNPGHGKIKEVSATSKKIVFSF